jgi:hypothetical protein
MVTRLGTCTARSSSENRGKNAPEMVVQGRQEGKGRHPIVDSRNVFIMKSYLEVNQATATLGPHDQSPSRIEIIPQARWAMLVAIRERQG